MPEQTYLALVLRRWDRGESDRRLAVLTREQGRLDVVAKGARKGGSRLSAATEPLSFARIQVHSGQRMAYVTQAEPQTAFRGLRADYDRLTMALAFAELVAAVSQTDLPDPGLFDLAFQALSAIELHPDPLVALVWAELQLMESEGVLPILDRCVVCDRPLAESPAAVSPGAGGNVCGLHAADSLDRYLVSGEVLIGLARTAELSEPPPRLKRALEGLRALTPLWEAVAHASLPARGSLLRELMSESP